MSNKNNGLPEGFEGDLVRYQFKAEKPIFWGPNQKTRYPDTYEEPSDWRALDLMTIPPMVRIITGGNFSPAFIHRSIYLGYQEESTPGPHGFTPSAFVQRADIVSLYSANKSTLDLLMENAGPYTSWFTGTGRWYFFLSNDITGDILTQHNALQWFLSDVDVDATGLNPGFSHVFFDNFVTVTGLVLQP